jgi:hypothetical protein
LDGCVVQGLSGLFASTFTITFAYIADIVAKVCNAALVLRCHLV